MNQIDGIDNVMNDIDLNRVDLNLLKAFDAIAREQTVTGAAERMGIGQPAMSHALGRLRELLADEMFVKTPRGMEPTALAQELIGPIRAALDQISDALSSGRPFDPLRDEVRFSVGITDAMAAGILPKLLTQLNVVAPGVSFDVHNLGEDRLETMLDDGTIDLAICFGLSDAGWRRTAILMRESACCAFDASMVSASDPITIDEFLAVPHIAISAHGDWNAAIDNALREFGTRKVLVWTSDYLLAGYLLHEVRAIATLPASFARRCRIMAGLALRALPFEVAQCDVSMTWHARVEENAKHIWLRRIIAVASRLMQGEPLTLLDQNAAAAARRNLSNWES